MLKQAVVAAAAVVLVLAAGPALGNTISPNPADLSDLDHTLFYTWGINLGAPPSGYAIDSASLFIDNIYDWQAETGDILYVHLLDNPPANAGVPSSRVTTGTDNENPSDAYAGQGPLLFTYTDTSGGLPSEDILYTFTAADLVTLNQYWANNGVFGFGFDPDCHYYNNGITFTYTVDPVPEPASLALLGIGLGGLALRRRFYA